MTSETLKNDRPRKSSLKKPTALTIAKNGSTVIYSNNSKTAGGKAVTLALSSKRLRHRPSQTSSVYSSQDDGDEEDEEDDYDEDYSDTRDVVLVPALEPPPQAPAASFLLSPTSEEERTFIAVPTSNNNEPTVEKLTPFTAEASPSKGYDFGRANSNRCSRCSAYGGLEDDNMIKLLLNKEADGNFCSYCEASTKYGSNTSKNGGDQRSNPQFPCETCGACLLHQKIAAPEISKSDGAKNVVITVNNSNNTSNSISNGNTVVHRPVQQTLSANSGAAARVVTIPTTKGCCRIFVVLVCLQAALGIAVNCISFFLLSGSDILVDFVSAPIWAGIPLFLAGCGGFYVSSRRTPIRRSYSFSYAFLMFYIILTFTAIAACIAASLLTGLHAVRIRSYTKCIPSSSIIVGGGRKPTIVSTSTTISSAPLSSPSSIITGEDPAVAEPASILNGNNPAAMVNSGKKPPQKSPGESTSSTPSTSAEPGSGTPGGQHSTALFAEPFFDFTTRFPGEIMCICQQPSADSMMLLHYYFGHNDCKAIFYSLKDQQTLLSAFNCFGCIFSLWVVFIVLRGEYASEQLLTTIGGTSANGGGSGSGHYAGANNNYRASEAAPMMRGDRRLTTLRLETAATINGSVDNNATIVGSPSGSASSSSCKSQH